MRSLLLILALAVPSAGAERIMISAGPAWASSRIDESSLGRRVSPSVTLRFPNRFVWVGVSGQYYANDSDIHDLNMFDGSLSALFRIDPFRGIVYAGPGLAFSYVDVEAGEGSSSRFAVSGALIEAGLVCQPQTFVGVDVRVLWRLDNEVNVGGTEVEPASSISISYSLFF